MATGGAVREGDCVSRANGRVLRKQGCLTMNNDRMNAGVVTPDEGAPPPPVLMIAFHFPPVLGSSGLLRTLKFSQYLAERHWRPLVLTAQTHCYPRIQAEGDQPATNAVTVIRAWGVDTQRHLAWRGRYWKWCAIPDRWSTWLLGGIWQGLRLIHREKPKVIWATYPIATAHLMGWVLSRLTGIPLVADFRDPMTEEDYPEDRQIWKVYRWIEQKVVRDARYSIFTSPGAHKAYAARYPHLAGTRFRVIPNGYDERDFMGLAEWSPEVRPGGPARKLLLLHSGILYPSERDPRAFFHALQELHVDGVVADDTLESVFRASGPDAYSARVIEETGLGQIVKFWPSIPYREALQEMMRADGLLLFQASNCNGQIPAKSYEYLRSRRPILGIVDPVGDTAQVLREAGVGHVADINDRGQIKAALTRFLSAVKDRTCQSPSWGQIERFSRQRQAGELSEVLRSLIQQEAETVHSATG